MALSSARASSTRTSPDPVSTSSGPSAVSTSTSPEPLLSCAVPTVPVTVDYELTPLGASLDRVVREVKTWAEAHMDDVRAARDEYDARPA